MKTPENYSSLPLFDCLVIARLHTQLELSLMNPGRFITYNYTC